MSSANANNAWREDSFRSSDGLSLYYRDYPGREDAVPVLCLHGLTRNSSDFDPLARALAEHRRVIVPDARGRGQSEYDPDRNNYHPLRYVEDTLTLLDTIGVSRVAAIGTSLGGWMTMLLARERPGLLAAAVLNDIGPEAHPEGLARVVAFAGRLDAAATLDEAIACTRECYEIAFPDWDAERWTWYAGITYRPIADGGYDLNSDRNIGAAIRAGVAGLPAEPWELFDVLSEVPTLVIHGALSDILTPNIIAKMRRRKRDLQVTTVPNRGHAPLLDEPEAKNAIVHFLSTVA